MISQICRGAVLAAAITFAGLPWAPAQAADIYKPAAAPPPEVAPPGYDVRTGWYIGGLLGYGFAETELNAAAGSFDFDQDGVIAGGLVGWSYINNQFLFGVEGDILGGDASGSLAFGGNTVNGSVDWLAGLRARAGVFVTPDVLLFGAIGYGWADIDLPLAGAGGGAVSETFSGIQYGAGAEVALSERWNLRLDYIYTDLDSETIAYPGGASVAYDPDVHQARAGLVLKF